jgi:hypothetical protein
MSTYTTNDRGSVLRDIDAVAATGRQDWQSHPGIAAWFEDETDLLRSIHSRWYHVLTGCLDVAMETGSGNLVEDVREAYGRARHHHPGLWAILEQHKDHPAIASAVRREHALLAQTACVAHSSEITARFTPYVPQQRAGLWQRLFAAA